MIEISNLYKSYKKNIIIENSAVQFKDNRISFIMGPNGSGKTTLIKCIMGIENYQGKITFNGKRIDEVRDECLVLWDDCPFYTNLNGFDNLIIFSERFKSKSDILQLTRKYFNHELLKTKVKKYSYGQKKKLALALVDILMPKYLIMDEISNGLDYDMLKDLKAYICQWSKDMTIILTGHQFSFYDGMIDDLYVIQDKRIIQVMDYCNGKSNLEEIYDENVY